LQSKEKSIEELVSKQKENSEKIQELHEHADSTICRFALLQSLTERQ